MLKGELRTCFVASSEEGASAANKRVSTAQLGHMLGGHVGDAVGGRPGSHDRRPAVGGVYGAEESGDREGTARGSGEDGEEMTIADALEEITENLIVG